MFNRKNLPELPINEILTPLGRFCTKSAFLFGRISQRKVLSHFISLILFILFIGIASLYRTAKDSNRLLGQYHSGFLPTSTSHCLQVMEPSVVATDLDETSDFGNEIEVENELVSGLSTTEYHQQPLRDFIFATRQSLYPLLYDLPPPHPGLQA